MSDRIAVMNAGHGRAARHARGALRAAGDAVRRRLHRHDQPAARRRSSADAAVRARRRASRWRSCRDGARGRAARRAQRPPGVDPPRRRTARRAAPADGGRVEQVAYLGTQRPVPGPYAAADWPHASSPRRPGPTPGRQRRRRRLAAAEALVLGRPVSRQEEVRHDHRHDGSIDRPRTRARPLHGRAPDQPAPAARADRGRRRRGGARPGHRRVHGVGRDAAAGRDASGGAGRRRRRPRRRRARRQRRRTDARADARGASCTSTTGPTTSARTSIRCSRRSTASRSPRLLRHRTTDVREARPARAAATTSRSRPRPTSRASSRDGVIQPLDLSPDPEHRNLGAEWPNPGYDPGNAALDAVHVVDDRRRLRHRRITDDADQLEGALGRRSTKATSRCSTTSARSSGARSSSSAFDANTTDDAELDEALALLEQQKPLVRTYTTDDIGDALDGRRLDRPPGAPTCTRSRTSKPNVELRTSPTRAASAAPTRWSSRGREAPDRRAPVHQPHARRAGQRRQHELHRLHGPERGGQGSSSTRRSSRTRQSTPTRRRRQLRSCSTSAPDLDKYLKRWQQLRRRLTAGGRRRRAPRAAMAAGAPAWRVGRARPARASAGWSLFFVVPLAIIFVVSLGTHDRFGRGRCSTHRRLDNYARALDADVPARRSELAPLRGDRRRSCRSPSATRSRTGSAATAGATRPCC